LHRIGIFTSIPANFITAKFARAIGTAVNIPETSLRWVGLSINPGGALLPCSLIVWFVLLFSVSISEIPV